MVLSSSTAPNLILLPMSLRTGKEMTSFHVLLIISNFADRYHGDTRHNLIVANQHSYTLNNVSAPLLYKLIHYFMENPINGETCLKYPIEEREVIVLFVKLKPLQIFQYHSIADK